MKLTIDRNCNIIIDSTRTGFVAVGAHSIDGQTALHYGEGLQAVQNGRTTHITNGRGEPLWTGHVSALTAEVFALATGYQQPDTIVITAPAGTKARWVHHAQSNGQKLSNWITSIVDQSSITSEIEEVLNIAEQIAETPIYFKSEATRQAVEALIQASATFADAEDNIARADAALWVGEAYLLFSASLPDSGFGEASTSWAAANQIAKILGGPAIWEQKVKTAFQKV